MRGIVFGLALAVLLYLPVGAASESLSANADNAEPIDLAPPMSDGERLARAAGCVLCHSAEDGSPLAGGRALQTPFGVLYSPNISPDKSTGIGNWSYNEFERALRAGIAPDGHYYFPAFPYTSYQGLSAPDVRAIFDYLQAQPAQIQRNRPDELIWPFDQRALLGLWRFLYFSEGQLLSEPARDARLRRGAYLVQAVSHCSECHTPRDALGGLRRAYQFAGARLSSGHKAPNITVHPKALAAWTPADLAEYLRTGRSDYGRRARAEMREFIEGASTYLSEDDRLAMAEYLLSLPAVSAPKAPGHGPRR